MDDQNDIFPPDYTARHKAQAVALKPEAAEHGLSFPGYFVPSVAEWVLTEVERGRFHAPSEAVFVAMQVFIELEAYPDLRQELFKREMEKRLADKNPGIPADEAFARLKTKMKQAAVHEPARWTKIPYPS
jgi:Arc/MetJ-type ribon-helix-helix transcriptional regulator